MQDFRQLAVWGRAHAFAKDIRKCAEKFPRPRYSDLADQITRAAESIPNNIVEGCGAATRKEFARYLDISIKSTSEVEYQLQLARENGLMANHLWTARSTEGVEIRKMLYGLRRAVLAADRASRAKRPKRRKSR